MEENIVIEDEDTPLASGKEDNVQVAKKEPEEAAKVKPGKQEKPVKPEKPAKPEKELSNGNQQNNSGNQKPDNQKPGNNKPAQKEKYKLVWEDNFNGDSLNRDDWNVELHAPGWVNAEWQEYVDSEENIYVEDGKLVIQAIKTEGENGDAYYTSGRVNTQNKHDFKYGKFEARIKVPSGKGFLPAFWMMPTDESYYGQWPKCGEIDIMEVMGQSTDTLHGTIHFGEPHTQKQGTYTAKKNDDFAEKFHVFSCEWEPGEIRWYVDGQLYYTANDWFTAKPGFDEVAYPAPFDQPFYMIFNLAVGGSWVGYPDETTEFGENAQLVVDYVKVYQKESYDENVTKPEKAPIEFKEPDATGNYVLNSDFSVNEDLTDDSGWKFLLAGSGVATANISEGELHIVTADAGDLDYSVQVVQQGMSLQQGKRYRMSYDMYTDEARTAIASVTAPDYNYVRYLADTKVNVTTEKQTFVHEFDMTVRDDVNGRVEFNLGNQGSTATLHISNVRLEVVGECEIPSDEKSVLPDGNYVYNGDFSYGANRLDYWNVPTTNVAGSAISVTNTDGVRELKVVSPETVTDLNQVVVEQKEIALTAGTKYVLTFDAHADRDNAFKACIAGSEFTCEVGTNGAAYAYSFVAGDTTEDYVLQFLLGTPGTTYIDNVRIQEDGMLVNGGFSNGLVGFETYNDASTIAAFSVDELNEGGAACIDIKDTGDADWKIQLKQNNVTLENEKWYKISFEAKSVTALGSAGAAFERDIMCALQRNGAVHKNPDGSEDWTPYLQKTVSLNGEYQKFDFVFQMMPGTEPKTDEGTILTFSMGAVGGRRITDSHIVVIDNVALEEVEAPEQEEIVAGENLILNPTFANNGENWEAEFASPGTGSYIYNAEESVTFNITNVGTLDWHAQLRTFGIRLENGASYKVSFKASSTADRTMSVNVMSASYGWYGGTFADLTNEPQTFEFSFDMTTDNADSGLFFSMGKISDEDTPVSVITISDVSVVKISGGNEETPINPGRPDMPDDPAENLGEELVKNGDFTNGQENWETVKGAEHYADITFADGVATFDIKDVGIENWHVQLKQMGILMKRGSTYQVSFDITSSETRTVIADLLNDDYKWYGGTNVVLEKDVAKNVTFQTTVNEETNDNVGFFLSMGKIADADNPISVIVVDNISIREVNPTSEPGGAEPSPEPNTPEVKPGDELVKNGDFANGQENWQLHKEVNEYAEITFAEGMAIFDIKNVGSADHHVQLKQSGIPLKQGSTYQVSFDIKSSEARTVRVALLDVDSNYDWYGGTDVALEKDVAKNASFEMKVEKGTCENMTFVLSMGKISDGTPASVIVVDNISIKEIIPSGEPERPITPENQEPPVESEQPTEPVELIVNGDFAAGQQGWEPYIEVSSAVANIVFEDGKANIAVENAGTANWHVKLEQNTLALEQGVAYKVSFKIKSSIARRVDIAVQNVDNDWLGGTTVDVGANTEEWQLVEFEVTPSGAANRFCVSMGQIDSESYGVHTIEIDDVSIQKK